jgi:phosphatidylinositol alpha-1,6-mannosyltransferase
MGWEVSVLTAQNYTTAEEADAFNREQPFPVIRWRRPALGPLRGPGRLASLFRVVKQVRPTIVLASGGRAVLLTAVVCGVFGIPWVAMGHGSEFGRTSGGMAAALRWAFRRTRAVICVSDYTQRLMHRFGVHPPTSVRIPNGADPERFRVMAEGDLRVARRKLGLPAGRWIVTVGQVSERKAQDIVVRAMPAILAAVADAHYVVVGMPTDGPALRKLSESLQVSDRVHLPGRLDDERLVEILNAAEVFVLTSRETSGGDVEGFGIVVVEAALCGLPAVVSSGSGLAEAICDGQTGLLVPPDDPEGTARAIVSLLTDEPRRRAMGEAARARAIAEQTWAGRAEAYDRLLREVSGAPPALARCAM